MTSSPSEQAAAARAGAVAGLPAACVLSVAGGDAADLLSRLSSNDLSPLSRGEAVTTLFLTPTGRVRHRVLLMPVTGGLRAVAEGSADFAAWVDAYTFAEDCRLAAEPGLAACLVVGAAALAPLPESFACARRDLGDVPAVVVTGPADDVRALPERLGLPLLSPEGWLQLRIELGIPEAGAELTEERFPLEAGLLQEISFTKGCYTGQEVVARQDTYGKVTRRLVILAFEAGSAPSAGELLASENKDGCCVTSVAPDAVSLPDGTRARLALGYVAARNAVPGTAVMTAGGLAGRVLSLR